MRRDRLQIYYDILSAINSEALNVKSRPGANINLSYKRFRIYIEELLREGFIIHNRDKILITEKGYIFLINYKNLLDLIRR